MKKTIIIAGFPGVGKSYLTDLYEGTDTVVCDSDSTNFSWLEPGVRHPDFPNNYINHIKSLIGEVDYIFVSTHEVVRNALGRENIEYVLVYPDKALYEEYIFRYMKRGSDKGFIDNMVKMFNTFVDQCENDSFGIKVKLDSNEYLSDVMDSIHIGLGI